MTGPTPHSSWFTGNNGNDLLPKPCTCNATEDHYIGEEIR